MTDKIRDAFEKWWYSPDGWKSCETEKSMAFRAYKAAMSSLEQVNNGWIKSSDKLHPDKPGIDRYEQVLCLIVRNGETLIRQWNCEHLVWDTEDGDDFYCTAEDVTHWMPVPLYRITAPKGE